MTKVAVVTGSSGQDGSYLCELLLKKNYKVLAYDRRSSREIFWRHNYLKITKKLNYRYFDLSDENSINKIFLENKVDEFYNLAAQSFVKSSFDTPVSTSDVTALGPLRILEAIKLYQPKVKFYQASSSEMFGGADKVLLNEESAFDPKSPYAASKVFSHNITKLYRESYGIFAVNGILFNHESPHRGETFVTRKISRAVARISLGIQEKLTLGNLEASRDWGFAGDYVMGMWMMLQHKIPEDWVLATGETYKVKDFLEKAFSYVNLNWENYVLTSEEYFRPNEVNYLLGDSTKAQKELKWKPKVSFDDLVKMMVDSDTILAKREQVLIKENLLLPTWEYPKV